MSDAPGEMHPVDLLIVGEDELDRLAGRGEVTDIKTLIGLQWLQRWRAGAWVLDWAAAPAGDHNPGQP